MFKFLSNNCCVKSTASVFDHPLHPIFISFPIVSFFIVLISDIIYRATKNVCWSLMSFWLLVIGLGGSVFSAATGIIDFVTIPSVRKLTIGWAHGIGNVMAVSASLANWLIRIGCKDSKRLTARLVLSIISAAILIVTGWWGGELSFRHGIGVKIKKN